jgi:hypothetical protein
MLMRSLRPLLTLLAATAAVLLLFDLTLFRSGLYYRWLEPESTAGSVVGATLSIPYFFDPGRKNVLVLGNSQIGEGFSALIADSAAARKDLHFINGAVAGTTPRVWYYLLRAVDPHADRFAAVALMVDYDNLHNLQDMGNYDLDAAYCASLLRIDDVLDFPASFSEAAQRERARRAILFPLQSLHDDAQALLAHPLLRYKKVRLYWPGWLASIAQYPGHEESLPELSVDPQSGLPSDWGARETALKPKLENYFRGMRIAASPELREANDAYEREWLGRITDRYAAHGIPVIAFVVPRGPWGQQLMPVPSARGAVDELTRDGRLHPLPGAAFVALERPQYFFDTLHMNRQGRERFSREFAQLVAPLVH